MRYVTTAIVLLLTLSLQLELQAGEIYKWTDKNGVVVITNIRPPKEVRSPKIIVYPDSPIAGGETVTPEAPIENAETRQANVRLEKAREEAEAAKVRAQEAQKTADDYATKLAPRNQKKRSVYNRRARLSEASAEEAQLELLKAEQNVVKAEAAAMALEKSALDAENRTAPADKENASQGP
ncbi:MAG: DUF4124 domain-containing protein [Pseudomonadota bacterium]